MSNVAASVSAPDSRLIVINVTSHLPQCRLDRPFNLEAESLGYLALTTNTPGSLTVGVAQPNMRMDFIHIWAEPPAIPNI